MIQVTKYFCAFHPTDRVGFIRLHYNNQTKQVFRDLPADVFNAFVNMLEHDVVYIDPHGWLTTDPQSPQDDN